MAATARETLIARVTEFAHRAAAGAGVELWDVELSGSGQNRVLRVYIDKPDGVTHPDCEQVSASLSAALDAGEVVPGGEYQLEVSSPGVERKLILAEHFSRFAGQKARLVLSEPVENRRRWDGTLTGLDGGEVVLEPQPGQTIRIRMDIIEKANLTFEW